MPTTPTERYLETYRKPFSPGVRRFRWKTKYKPKSEGTGLRPRGRPRESHLGELIFATSPYHYLERRAVPKSAYPDLTVIERIFLNELLKRHLREWIDFGIKIAVSANNMGNRWTGYSRYIVGTYAPNFFLYNTSTAIEVEGGVWHSGILPYMKDESKEVYLRTLGIRSLFIQENVLIHDDLTQAWFRRELGM